MKPIVREILITVVLVAAIFIGTRVTTQGYEVLQLSMEPNFSEGQRVMVNKAAYWFNGPQRGDVVIFTAPDGSDEEFIKRVIGLPGDTVEIVKGVTYVNGIQLDEPYVKRSFTYTMHKKVVPEGNYFVLGDNRDASNDSHRGWFMSRESLIGKAWLVYWPAGDWGIVPGFPLNDQVAASDNISN